jgi:transposase
MLATAFGTRRCHDFRLYKETNVRVYPEVELLADKGYQGILKHHANSKNPHRKPRKNQLPKDHRQHNRGLAKRRIVVEQTNRRLNVWRIFSSAISKQMEAICSQG